MKEIVRSPLTFSNNVIEIGKINPEEIITIYSSYYRYTILF